MAAQFSSCFKDGGAIASLCCLYRSSLWLVSYLLIQCTERKQYSVKSAPEPRCVRREAAAAQCRCAVTHPGPASRAAGGEIRRASAPPTTTQFGATGRRQRPSQRRQPHYSSSVGGRSALYSAETASGGGMRSPPAARPQRPGSLPGPDPGAGCSAAPGADADPEVVDAASKFVSELLERAQQEASRRARERSAQMDQPEPERGTCAMAIIVMAAIHAAIIASACFFRKRSC
ncbi:uncharacterized protein LOC126282335 [Schistocerca gregaria]|uniref:uncharacterized protein LOC126282335 n=1 Tax=Schistocerca gregaria TaxID=7010 RepID=UPI00211EA9B7|nr:uncharacterized protein LOC126282335 [Schistocerca gregaria]